MVCALMGSAQALESHADQRFSGGWCPTWGPQLPTTMPKYGTVSVWMHYTEVWDFAHSNYPVKTVFTPECQYMGQPDPVKKPGESYVVRLGGGCYAKTYVAPDGTKKTSYPLLTGGYTVDYNEGWSFGQVWCAWDKDAYGSPIVTTSTTTMMPPTTLPNP
jgi:hypothetical protein